MASAKKIKMLSALKRVGENLTASGQRLDASLPFLERQRLILRLPIDSQDRPPLQLDGSLRPTQTHAQETETQQQGRTHVS